MHRSYCAASASIPGFQRHFQAQVVGMAAPDACRSSSLLPCRGAVSISTQHIVYSSLESMSSDSMACDVIRPCQRLDLDASLVFLQLAQALYPSISSKWAPSLRGSCVLARLLGTWHSSTRAQAVSSSIYWPCIIFLLF